MSKFIGNKEFYKKLLFIAVPIMVQNGITNLVSLLDNIMVGQLGTEAMSGVAIVNQLMMIFQLCIFGTLAGASLYMAQFYGQGNRDGLRDSFRYKVVTVILMGILWVVIFLTLGDPFIQMFLTSDGTSDLTLTQTTGHSYLLYMAVTIIPFSISQIYSSTLRDIGQTRVPMISSMAAMLTNLILNWVLIFGNLGAPKLGVSGAAIATIIARIIELLILVIYMHSHTAAFPFMAGVYSSLRIPTALLKRIFLSGLPLIFNETLFALGLSFVNQSYSTRGLSVVAAVNIAAVINQVFNVFYAGLGMSISIIVGQQLGAGELEKARDTDRKIIFFSVCSCFVIGALLFTLAPLFPMLYKTTAEVKALATGFLRVASVMMPIMAFYHAAYFTLRTGGKTVITFLFDSVYLVCVNGSIAYILCHFTSLPIMQVYMLVQTAEIIKFCIGFILLRKGVWVNNLVEDFK